jgi:heptaprenyl diphosphate synthase
MKSRKVARYGLLVALALVLSYLESLVPVFVAVPGMKLGLTNLVVMMALYKMSAKDAIALNFVRIVLVSLTFGNAFSLIYSLAGGMLSCLVMILLKKSGRFGMLGVSVAGGVFHNIGQILVAMVLLETWQIASYVVVLWVSGVAAGVVIGILSGEIVRRLPDDILKGDRR